MRTRRRIGVKPSAIIAIETNRGASVEWQPVKTTLIFVLLGALAGIAVASLVVAPARSWYSEPRGQPNGAPNQALVANKEVKR